MENIIEIGFRKEHPDAKIPQYAHGYREDAGMDLFSIEKVRINPGETQLIETGVVMEIPPGIQGEIRSKSGLALDYSVVVLNSPGTIDPGYKGTLGVILINHGKEAYIVDKGDKVAQLVITPYYGAKQVDKNIKTNTSRGRGGFGHTGK